MGVQHGSKRFRRLPGDRSESGTTQWLRAGVFVVLATAAASALAQAPGGDDEAYVRRAESGGPAEIAAAATIARIDARATLVVVRPGSNGVTCVVGVPGDEDSPFCADEHGLQWILDAWASRPRPTNAAPGVIYMARGGLHHETATGEIATFEGPDTVAVREPPHWMLMWPFDPEVTGLPTKENDAGVYIMYAGSPFAHLMIYQDPDELFQGKAAPGR